MKRNGRAKTGRQRWRCRECGGSATHAINTDERDLRAFLSWLMSKDAQIDMPGQGRTFRRRTSRFWHIWPMPEATGEACKVVYVDGIYLARSVCVLIAYSDEHVLAWYLRRAETARAWKALMAYVAPPEMVVTDGGSGFAKACREVWPETRVQRCVLRTFCQVRRYTTSRPNLQAGVELYALAKELLHLETLAQAQWRRKRFVQWCGFWCDFLEERSTVEDRPVYTHERLRRARSGLVALGNQEGAVHLPRPRAGRGAPAARHQQQDRRRGERALALDAEEPPGHVGDPQDKGRVLVVPHEDGVQAACGPDPRADAHGRRRRRALRAVRQRGQARRRAPQWGDGLVWGELHHATDYPYAVD